MQEGLLNQGMPIYNANNQIHQMDMQQKKQNFKESAQDAIIPNKKLFIENIE